MDFFYCSESNLFFANFSIAYLKWQLSSCDPLITLCSSSSSTQELMSQRQKLAVEREKLQAELEHFRKCLTLPQTHWPRSSHYKGYPPRWPRHADQSAARPPGRRPLLTHWLTLRVYFYQPGPRGSTQENNGCRVSMDGWMDEWMKAWMDERMVQDHGVRGRSSMDCACATSH